MANQNASTVRVSYKKQSGLYSPASGAGATQLIVTPGNSMAPTIPLVENDDIRTDGQRSRGRQGVRGGGSGYNGNLKIGVYDPFFEAVLRTTASALATIGPSDVTSVTTTTSTIVGASGSFLTAQGGVQVADLVKFTGLPDAANNNKWFRVVGVNATTITLPTGSLVLNATPDTTFSIVRAKRMTQGTTDSYWTFEEYLADIVGSLRLVDAVVSKIDVSMAPNQNIKIVITTVGTDVRPLDGTTTPTSPFFSSPTLVDAAPLRMMDGIIRVNGVDRCILTAFNFSIDLSASAVLGLCATAIDISKANAKVTGSFSAVDQDMAFYKAASDDTVVELFVTASEVEADPADTLGFYFGNVMLMPPSSPIASEGLRTSQFNWEASNDATGAGRPSTMIKVVTTAP